MSLGSKIGLNLLFVCLILAIILITVNFGFVTFMTWEFVLGAFSVFASWVVIIFLLVERHEKDRPYLQITFDPIRSTLACIVIKNTGSTPAKLKSLKLSKEFTSQLKKDVQQRLEKYQDTSVTLFPGQIFAISLDVNVFDIINEFEQKTVSINCKYCHINSNYSYKNEEIVIDWREYSGFLVYASQLDEIRISIDKLRCGVEKTTNSLNSNLQSAYMHLESVATFCDEWQRYVACRINNEEKS